MAAPEIFGGAAAAKTRILKPRIAVQFAIAYSIRGYDRGAPVRPYYPVF